MTDTVTSNVHKSYTKYIQVKKTGIKELAHLVAVNKKVSKSMVLT